MIQRILVQSNVIVACFFDGTVVQLSKNGEYFSILYHPTTLIGEQQNHTNYFRTHFALSNQQPYILPALKFVNMYIENDHISILSDSHSKRLKFKQSDSKIDFVNWPLNFEEIKKSKVVHQDGSIKVISSDQLCHLTLSPHSQSFVVTYPALLNQDTNTNGKFEYEWVNQVYSVRCFPLRWEFPLLCALLVYLNDENGEQWPVIETILLSNEYCENDSLSSNSKSLFTEDCCRTESCFIVSLPHSNQHNVQIPPLFQLEPFVFSQSSYSRDHKTLIEWTEKALYRFLPLTKEVEVSIFEDNSCLLTQQKGDLFYHYTTNFERHVYSKNELLEFSHSHKPKRYSLTDIAKTALRLRENNSFIQETANVQTLQPVNEIIDEITLEKIGVFTAYKNGNIHVRFFDRTILDLFSNRCKIITRDAHEILLTTCMPQEYEPYISHAVEFKNWVSLPLEQKLNFNKRKEGRNFDYTTNIVNEHLNSTRRFIDIYKIRNGKSL